MIIYIANIGLGNIWVEGGLISQIVLYLITTFLLRTILPILDFPYLWKRLLQWLAINGWFKKNYTQKELNKLFEFPSFDFPQYTANMLGSIFHS